MADSPSANLVFRAFHKNPNKKNKTAMELRLEHHLTPPSRRGYAGHVGSDHQIENLI